MKINSQFKDYYDFVAYEYGGGDPRIVYSRQRIVPVDSKKPRNNVLHVDITDCHFYDPASYNRFINSKWQRDYLYLIIAGKAYLLARPYSYLDRYDINTYKVVDLSDDSIPHWVRHRHEMKYGEEYDCLVELCRKVGSPVFAIAEIQHLTHRQSKVSVCGQCPILSRIGMASRIDPYQMYQDIAMFVGNRMKDPPDTQPPVELGNNQKIIKAGFDLKQSFRHRV
jgi:hypothetical protein